MSARWRTAGAVSALAVPLVLAAAPARAQVPAPPPKADTTAAVQDTAVVDSLIRGVRLPVPNPAVPQGPLPPGSRYTFTRDSILWSGGLTLADLLTRIPGVYVLRAGFVGEPEYIQYYGRGGTALEVYWDGMPWVPLGGDTVAVDPGQFPLTYLRQVDVEVQAGVLRVYLVSERHETPAVRTKVRVQSGAFKSAQYAALFQKRMPGGLGLDLGANYVGTDGPNQAAGADAFDIWGKVSWMPTDRVGMSYQVRRQNLKRDGIGGGQSVPALDGARTDMQFDMFAQSRGDGLGFSGDIGVASSFWTADSGVTPGRHGVRQVHAGLRYRGSTLGIGAEIRGADARTPLAADARLGWTPLSWFVVAGDAGYRRHEHDRTSKWVRGSAGIYYGPLSLVGEAAVRDVVAAPVFAGDTAQATTDLQLRLGLRSRWLSGNATVQKRDAYAPVPYLELPIIPALGPSPKATYLVADAYLSPISALTLSGQYSNPVSGEAADFQPPQHVRAALTLRSKFWRTFRSGAFDLKLQVATERWAEGTGGMSDQGTPIRLPAAQFWDFQVEVQLVSFTAFWVLRNGTLSEDEFVPGLPYPGNAQYFGASWVFGN